MKRNIEENILNKLLLDNLWINQIKNDCKKQKVFLAIRNNEIDFYRKGGRLFNFGKNGFKTHIKYAATIESTRNNYLTENELSKYKLALDFYTNYNRIMENCANYSGVEAIGVSDIYHKHSYISEENVVVLDIEVSFKSLIEDKKQDRIDILFLNKSDKSLMFVEAKHYSNMEIWSKGEPDVVQQIRRYENQILKNKNEILTEYSKYIKIINSIFDFDKPFPEPKEIELKVPLLIFDFDNDQKKGRLKKHILSRQKDWNIKIYPIGNINNIVPDKFWKVITRKK